MPLEGRYAVVDHACRHCMGRILELHGRFICSVCEAVCSLHPRGICGCGMRPPKGVPLPGPAHKHYRCGPNPRIGTANLAKIVVLYGETVINPLDHDFP